MALAGCHRYFSVDGDLVSHGGLLGEFRSTPQGCSRDPFDGLPASESSSVFTLLWNDPAARDIKLRGAFRFAAPDAPLRLEVTRLEPPATFGLDLHTVKTDGVHLDGTTCSTLRVDTQETPRTMPEGRGTLAGRLQLDCSLPTSTGEVGKITADIHFQRCEF